MDFANTERLKKSPVISMQPETGDTWANWGWWQMTWCPWLEGPKNINIEKYVQQKMLQQLIRIANIVEKRTRKVNWRKFNFTTEGFVIRDLLVSMYTLKKSVRDMSMEEFVEIETITKDISTAVNISIQNMM